MKNVKESIRNHKNSLLIKLNNENNFTHYLKDLVGKKINILNIEIEDSYSKNDSLDSDEKLDIPKNKSTMKNFDKSIYFFKNKTIQEKESILIYKKESDNFDNPFYIFSDSYIKVLEPISNEREILLRIEYELINDNNIMLSSENSKFADESYKQNVFDNFENFTEEDEDDEISYEQEESEESEESKSEQNSSTKEQGLNENTNSINEEQELGDLLDEANDLNEDLLLGDSDGEIEYLLNSTQYSQSLQIGANTNNINNSNENENEYRGKNYMLRRKRRSGNNF